MNLRQKSILKVNIRKRHPNLYYLISLHSVTFVALGFNFFYSNPTFNPLHIPKNVIGTIFMGLGLSQLFFLNISRNLRVVRLLIAVAVSFVLFWGLANTQQFFAHKASLQLPLMYMSLAFLKFPLLLEPVVNPVTERIKNGD